MLPEISPLIATVYGADPEALTSETHFEDDLGGDSLDFLQLVTQIEALLRIQIPDEASGNVHTVGDLVELIQKCKSQGKPPQRA